MSINENSNENNKVYLPTIALGTRNIPKRCEILLPYQSRHFNDFFEESMLEHKNRLFY